MGITSTEKKGVPFWLTSKGFLKGEYITEYGPRGGSLVKASGSPKAAFRGKKTAAMRYASQQGANRQIPSVNLERGKSQQGGRTGH